MTKEEKFAEVFQEAIDVAEHRLANYDSERDPLKRSNLKEIIRILRDQKHSVLGEGVEVYDGPYGPGYYLIDLGEPADSALRRAVFEIEVFYKKTYVALMTRKKRYGRIVQAAIELAVVRLLVYDADADPLTRDQLDHLIRLLSEERRKVVFEAFEPPTGSRGEIVKMLSAWGEPADSPLSYVVREVQTFPVDKF